MSSELLTLKPELLWKHFAGICAIPHPSKEEQALADMVIAFGKENGLETVVDEVGNVLVRKPATPGMEDRKVICLQGHLDMVPQKNSDTVHDFSKDPIQAYIDGEWVTAKGTTLGADNGIGCAAAMAVLESKDLVHGPVEALFTIDEETGMTGAFGLKPGFVKADIMINLDSEDEGELYIGCAGGEDTNVEFTYKEEPVPADVTAYKVLVTGLKGGHSGMDIPLGRGNSIKIMNRLFHNSLDMGLRIASIDGGSLRNAIPREAFAVVVVNNKKAEEFEGFVKDYEQVVCSELSGTEPDMSVKVEKYDMPDSLIDTDTQDRLIKSIYACPNGVIRMSDAMEGLVETSTNLAVLKSENGKIKMGSLQRSSVDTAKDDLCAMIRSVFELAGAEVEHDGRYPGWNPNINSPVLKQMKKLYEDMHGVVPEVKAIHAGLECGLIGAVYPELDMISCGPTIRFPHSPDEKVNIESVGKFWDYLVKTLETVEKK